MQADQGVEAQEAGCDTLLGLLQAVPVVEMVEAQCRHVDDGDVEGPWLAGDDISLGSYPADEMHAHPVSMLVNKPANDDPRCDEPEILPYQNASPCPIGSDGGHPDHLEWDQRSRDQTWRYRCWGLA